MKKLVTSNLAILCLLALLFSCRKEPIVPGGLKLPTLSINKISELPFSNTEWQHVFGGMAEIKYINGSSTITDSLDLAKLSGYQKTLELGTYDVQLRSKSTATADTFIRFAGELKGLVVDKGKSISFSAITGDGLITIKKESVRDNSVPTFTPAQAGAKSYKLGLINGYYFIYVTGGTAGRLSFYSKVTDDLITKDLSIVATNHYNLVVVTNGTSSLSVELQKFVYNEVPLFPLALLKIETPGFMNPGFDFTFVIADDTGKILNSYNYQEGTTSKQIESNVPFTKDRVSVFLLSRDLSNVTQPRIDAYMNVKKGSTWTVPPKPVMRPYSSPLLVTFKYVPEFKQMTFSTDRRGWNMYSANDVTSFSAATFSFSEVSKAYLQIETQDKAFYNLFALSKDTRSLEIDPALVNIPSASKSITLPGPGSMFVIAKKDKNYNEHYFLGSKAFDTGAGVYFYPNEPFQEYSTIFRYASNGLFYADSFQGAAVPQTTSPMELNFKANGSTLATFNPTFNGNFDHYKAEFHRSGPLVVVVVSTALAPAEKLSYPDLSAYTGFADFDSSSLLLAKLEAFQYEDFSENQLPYKDWHAYDLKGKALSTSD